MFGFHRWLVPASFTLVLGVGSVVSAQVTMTAGSATGAPGDTVELPITVTGPDAAGTAVARFRIAYDTANAVYDPIYGPGGTVECFVAGDLAGHVTPGPVFFQPDQNRIVVAFGDFQAPVEAFGRAGVVMTCRVAIRPDARNGNYPLFCLGASSASTAAGKNIVASCAPGTLTVSGASSDQGDVRFGGRPPVAPQVEVPAPAAPAAAQPTRGRDSVGGSSAGSGTTQVATPVTGRQDSATTPGSVEHGGDEGASAQRPSAEGDQHKIPVAAGTAAAGATPATTASPGETPSPKITATSASSPTAKKTVAPKKVEETPAPKEDAGGCQMNLSGGGCGGVLLGLFALVVGRRRR